MDVVLLSRMIRDLMLDRDSLSLPGLGTFGAESMPASFSDRGFTINPPYRRLTFSKRETSDGLLAELYARSNGIGVQEAEGIIRAFSDSLSKDLRDNRSVEFPGLGRLRSTREGHLFFVPDQDLDITPDACGLESVSLKSHAPIAALGEQLPPVVAPEPEDACGTETGSVSGNCGRPWPPRRADVPWGTTGGEFISSRWEGPGGLGGTPPNPLGVQGDKLSHRVRCEAEVSGGTSSAVEQASSGTTTKLRKRNRPLRWAIGAVAAAVLLLGVFTLVSRIAPGFTDRLLYTEEQLAIINAPEDGTYLPR